MTRRFVERDHPRWPGGSGDKSGEFRDKTPDLDWASRVSAAIDSPAGRHGSVPTGLTEKCPVCGRTVKVVGAGKLSTHNNPATGRKCTGSGLPASIKPPPGVQKAPGGARTPRKATGGKPRTDRPPPAPQVQYGGPLETVFDTKARARLDRWRAEARHDTDATRQAKIHQARRDILSWEQGLERERHKARRELARLELGRQPWDYIPPEEIEAQAAKAENLQDVAYYRRSLESRQAALERLLKQTPDRPFDPANPLAYYGQTLHIESNDWHVYEALDELEQRVPPVFHRVVAEFLQDRLSSELQSGIWIGSSQSVRDLDDLRRKLTRPPGGDWAKNATVATWDRVDGVVHNDSVFAVSHTDNAESHRRSRQAALWRAGLHDKVRPTGSASLHEFGHLLDHALGFFENNYRHKPSDASEQRRFRLLYSEAKQRGRFSPHFRQKGDAGPREFWADAFFTWSAVDPTPRPYEQRMLIAFRDSKRPLTSRDLFMAESYSLPLETAVKIVDYFDRLEKEVTTGKRLPTIELVARRR